MEYLTTLDIIIDAYFDKWKDEIRKNDTCGLLDTMLKYKEYLQKQFTEEQLKIIHLYTVKIENFYEEMILELSEKLLKISIKMGIDFQKIISEDI